MPRFLPGVFEERIEWWFSPLCATPWLVIFGVYLEVCIARLSLSRWPRLMLDDPKQLATAPLHSVNEILLFSLVVTVPVLIVWASWNWRKIAFGDRRYRVGMGAFTVGLVFVWALMQYDPGRVWYWFLD
jgi:hypothetical protein